MGAKARTPLEKAKAMLDLATGHSIGAVAERYGFPKPTVQRWHEQLKKDSKQTDTEIKRKAFEEAMEEFGVATMKMLTAQANLLADPGYIVKQITRDVIAHTKFVLGGLHGLINLERGFAPAAPALESSNDGIITVQGEPVPDVAA